MVDFNNEGFMCRCLGARCGQDGMGIIDWTAQIESTNDRIDYLILHEVCANTAKEAIEQYKDSMHYVIDKDGKAYRFVDERKAAHNKDLDAFSSIKNFDKASINIGLISSCNTQQNTHEAQLNKASEVVKHLEAKYNISHNNILLSPSTGTLLQQLYNKFEMEDGIYNSSLTNAEQIENFFTNPNAEKIYKLQIDLANVGYKVPATGAYDNNTIAVVQQFNEDFCPEPSKSPQGTWYKLSQERLEHLMGGKN